VNDLSGMFALHMLHEHLQMLLEAIDVQLSLRFKLVAFEDRVQVSIDMIQLQL
jgi:hypothetical protein